MFPKLRERHSDRTPVQMLRGNRIHQGFGGVDVEVGAQFDSVQLEKQPGPGPRSSLVSIDQRAIETQRVHQRSCFVDIRRVGIDAEHTGLRTRYCSGKKPLIADNNSELAGHRADGEDLISGRKQRHARRRFNSADF